MCIRQLSMLLVFGIFSWLQYAFSLDRVLSFFNFRNNSLTSPTFEVTVDMNLKFCDYNYTWLMDNVVLCVDNMFNVQCFPLQSTTITVNFVWELEPSDAYIPVYSLLFITFLTNPNEGQYSVLGKDGYSIFENQTIIANIATHDSLSVDVRPILNALGPNNSVNSAMLVIFGTSDFDMTVSNDNDMRQPDIVLSALHLLLGYSPKRLSLAYSSHEKRYCEMVSGIRKFCCEFDAGNDGDLADCDFLSSQVAIIVVKKSAVHRILDRIRIVKYLNLVKDIVIILSELNVEETMAMIPTSEHHCFQELKNSIAFRKLSHTVLIGRLQDCHICNNNEANCSMEDMDTGVRQRISHYLQQSINALSVPSDTGIDSIFLLPQREILTSDVQFEFNYGVNMGLLTHVYLTHEATVLAVDSRLEEYRQLLQRSDSGFHRQAMWNPTALAFVSCSENSWDMNRFLSCNDAGYEKLPSDTVSLYQISTVVKFSKVSVVLVPPYTPSVFHSAQVLLGLFYQADKYLSLCRDVYTGTFVFESDRARMIIAFGKLAWINRVRRIVLPSVSVKDYPWALGLLRITKDFMLYARDTCSSLQQSESIRVSADATAMDYIQVYFQEDIDLLLNRTKDEIFRDNSMDIEAKTLIELDEMVAVGAMELRVAMFRNTQACETFRNYAYSSLGFQQIQARCGATLGPNSPLNITILMRSKSRWLLNLQAIGQMILSTGLIGNYESFDQSPYLKMVSFEELSFVDQVSLLRSTDILISPHGAGLQNFIFMEAHSAVIEIMTSPWYEQGYQATASMCDIHFSTVAHSRFRMEDVKFCGPSPECLEQDLLVHRRSLTCYAIRQCSAFVDIDALEIHLWQASQSVRIKKRNIEGFRKCNEQINSNQFYNKAYDSALRTSND